MSHGFVFAADDQRGENRPQFAKQRGHGRLADEELGAEALQAVSKLERQHHSREGRHRERERERRGSHLEQLVDDGTQAEWPPYHQRASPTNEHGDLAKTRQQFIDDVPDKDRRPQHDSERRHSRLVPTKPSTNTAKSRCAAENERGGAASAAKIGPIELERELTKVAEQGQQAVSKLSRLNELMAESRLLELEITEGMFGGFFDEEKRAKLTAQIEAFRQLTNNTAISKPEETNLQK